MSVQLDRVWRLVIPSTKSNFGAPHLDPITDLVFSPSGRYGVDINRRKTPDGSIQLIVLVLDMLTMTQTRIKSKEIEFLRDIMNTYWIGETEIVIVGYENVTQCYVQVYCRLNMEEGVITVTRQIRIRTPLHRIADFPHQRDLIRHNGINPLYFNGGRYCVLNNLEYLTLVPWNVNYGLENICRINLPLLEVDGYTSYGPTFCLGSKIYCPVIERDFDVDIHGRRLHRIYIDRMVCIDVQSLEFFRHEATARADSSAVSLVKFTKIACTENTTLNSIRFHQHGEYLIGTEKIFLSPQESLSPRNLQFSIWIINLRDKTVHHTTIENMNNNFFVFLYDGYLMAFRHLINNRCDTWKINFMTIQYKANSTNTLFSLCKKTILNRRLPVPSDLLPIIFPEAHCCVPIMSNYDIQTKKFKCFCKRTI